MIISASRRTDIPCCYSDWLLRRLQEGYALVRNPYNARQLSRVDLSPEKVDCIVFWSKNPAPLMPHLPAIRAAGYCFYFQFTLTPYADRWEPGLPPLKERLNTLCALSEQVGPQRVVWRYDPVILDGDCSLSYHTGQFAFLCRQLSPYVDECVFSFADQYRHLKGLFPSITPAQMDEAARELGGIAQAYGISLSSCCEEIDLHAYGITHSSCIDQKRIERLLGMPIQASPDPGQRPGCGCIQSVDIGEYGTCPNGCRYCYASRSQAAAQRRYALHDARSPLLTGWPQGDETITDRSAASCKIRQTSLFS